MIIMSKYNNIHKNQTILIYGNKTLINDTQIYKLVLIEIVTIFNKIECKTTILSLREYTLL